MRTIACRASALALLALLATVACACDAIDDDDAAEGEGEGDGGEGEGEGDLATGEPCDADADCQSGTCAEDGEGSGKTCRPQECPCAGGLVCASSGVCGNQCAPPLAEGAACLREEDADECMTVTPCAPGLICSPDEVGSTACSPPPDGATQGVGELCGYYEPENPDTRFACSAGLSCFDDNGRAVLGDGDTGPISAGVSEFAVCREELLCGDVSCPSPNVCFVHPEGEDLLYCLPLGSVGGGCDSYGGTGQCPYPSTCVEIDFKQGTCLIEN